MSHVQCVAPNNIMLQCMFATCSSSLKGAIDFSIAPKTFDIFESTECFHGLGPVIFLYYVTKYGQTI